MNESQLGKLFVLTDTESEQVLGRFETKPGQVSTHVLITREECEALGINIADPIAPAAETETTEQAQA